MELIIFSYDNALIYSPNVFFIFLAFLLSFTALLMVNVFYFIVKNVNYAIEYIIEIRKKRKKTKHNRIKFLLKIIHVVCMIANRKKARIILYVKKILNAVKEEVLIKEGERI